MTQTNMQQLQKTGQLNTQNETHSYLAQQNSFSTEHVLSITELYISFIYERKHQKT